MRRTNGSRNSSCATFMPATIFSRRSTRRRGIPTISLLRSGRAGAARCVGGRRPRAARNRRRTRAPRTYRRGRPRLVGGPTHRRRRARVRAAAPPPTRAACKAMRRAGEHEGIRAMIAAQQGLSPLLRPPLCSPLSASPAPRIADYPTHPVRIIVGYGAGAAGRYAGPLTGAKIFGRARPTIRGREQAGRQAAISPPLMSPMRAATATRS